MLNQAEKDSLNSIVEKLNDLDDILSEKEVVHHFIEIIDNGSEVQLKANAEGCIYMASMLLNLAEKRIDNNHYQIDEASMADVCEKDIIFVYKSAEWDK